MPATKLQSPQKVLLTGGTGFVASHVLDSLLDHGFEVVVTARSADKGQRIVEAIEAKDRDRVSFAVVDNVASEGAFDEVMKSTPFDFVVHTASPYQLRFEDPVRDCLDPAIKGTTGILRAVKAHAPTVQRVVITSSSAAILSPPNHPAVYDESCWCDLTWEQATDPQFTYRASKKFSEKAAWDFMATENPAFDLATINNTYTFGPLPRSLDRLASINISNERIHHLVAGKMRDKLEPTAPVWTFVDVRDVALAHVRAMTLPQAKNSRFYMVAGLFSNARLADIIRTHYPHLADRLPDRDMCAAGDDLPPDHWKFDTTRSREVLGIQYTDLDTSVRDTVQSILQHKDMQGV